MRASLWLIVLLLPTASATPFLTAVVPDLPGQADGDEGFAIGSNTAMDITGWQVTDGESTITIPPLQLLPGQEAWFTGNTSYWMQFAMPNATQWDRLQLGNSGDDLALLDQAGNVIDAFAWGDKTHPNMEGAITYKSPGAIYRRDTIGDNWVDSDSYLDWQTPRIYRVGQTDVDARPFLAQGVTLYASPDSSFRVLTELIGTARQSIVLHTYTLRSPPLVEALLDAMANNPILPVTVLVTEQPVGLDQFERSQTAHALRQLQENGANVLLGGNDRYDYYHLKVLVTDGKNVAIQSENWVPTGVPDEPTWGNRGWGTVIHDGAFAAWMDLWMEADREAFDTTRFDLRSYDPNYREPSRFQPRTGDYWPIVDPIFIPGPVRIEAVISPEHSGDPRTDPISALVSSAQHRVLSQQLDLRAGAKNSLGWSAPDPLHEALANAAKQAEVRVHVASPFNSQDLGNEEAVRALLQHGVRGAYIERPGIATLHNKGTVVDDAVVVGSINGNHHSRSENREVAVIIHNGQAAEYFAELFWSDDQYSAEITSTGVLEPEVGIPGLAALPNILLLVAVVALVRWRQ